MVQIVSESQDSRQKMNPVRISQGTTNTENGNENIDRKQKFDSSDEKMKTE